MRTSVVVMYCALMGCADSGEFGAGFIWGSATAVFKWTWGVRRLQMRTVWMHNRIGINGSRIESVNDGRLYITGDPVALGPVCGRPLKRTWPA